MNPASASDPSIWSVVQAVAEGLTAVASIVALGFAYKTVRHSLKGAHLQQQLKAVDKKERQYNRLVLDPAHEELIRFEALMTAQIDAIFNPLGAKNAQTTLDSLLPDAIGSAIVADAQRRIISLRERFRFYEFSYGPGDGTLWSKTAAHLQDLEDAIFNAVDNSASEPMTAVGLTRIVRDGVALTLKELTAYDMRVHVVTEAPTGSFLPSWKRHD